MESQIIIFKSNKSSTPSSSSSISVTVLDSEDHLIDDSQMTYLYRINNELLNDYKLLFSIIHYLNFVQKGNLKLLDHIMKT